MTVRVGDDAHPNGLHAVAVERADLLTWDITYYANHDGVMYGQAADGAVGYQHVDDMDVSDVAAFMVDTMESPTAFGGLYADAMPPRGAGPDPYAPYDGVTDQGPRARLLARARNELAGPPHPDDVAMRCTAHDRFIMWVSPPAPSCRVACPPECAAAPGDDQRGPALRVSPT